MIKAEDNITLISNKETYDIASDTAQFFWVEETGADTGAHITEVPKEEWNDTESQNYHTGGNLLARSNGIAVRDGLTELATFGTDVQIGRDADENTRTLINSEGMQVIHKDTNSTDIQIAHLGYGSAKVDGGLGDAPYYTLGVRGGASVGSYSVVEGFESKAYGIASHAEGYQTSAQEDYAHAEGYKTKAFGSASHAGGYATQANGDCQTAIGKYNDVDLNNEYALIIGNGGGTASRSNALTVDWQGNLAIAGQHQELFKATQVTKVLTGGVNANSYIQATNIAMTPVDGYNAVGIVGHSSSNFRVQPTSEYVASNSAIFAGFANWSASNVTSDVTVIFYVLWLKATQA